MNLDIKQQIENIETRVWKAVLSANRKNLTSLYIGVFPNYHSRIYEKAEAITILSKILKRAADI